MESRARWAGRRLVTWLSLLGLAAAFVAVPASAAAKRPGTITVVGRGDSSVVVRLTTRTTLDTGQLDPMGGPGYGKALASPYFGYAFSRVRDGKVVAGWIRSRYMENRLGVYSNLAVGPGNVLIPGRYRLTLFGKGHTRLRLRTEDLQRSVTWKTRKRTPVRFALAPLEPSTARPYLLEHRAKLRVTRSKYVGFGIVSKRETPNPTANYACLVPPGTDLCATKSTDEPGTTMGPFVTLAPGGSGSQTWVQPGRVPAGRYEVLHQGTPGVPGNTTAYYLLAFG